VKATVTANPDFSAKVALVLSYHPSQKEEVLSEKCEITISAPDKEGNYRIDWKSCFAATNGDVLLDRTPVPGEKGGKGHGGYAGISIRMAKRARSWTFSDSKGRVDKAIHGQRAEWVSVGGKTAASKDAGIAIIDHRANMRHPSPWYVAKNMPYFSPAVLFNKAHSLKKGEEFTLRYRIVIHSGKLDKASMDHEMKRFK
jgi:hypothetical protein